MFTSNKENDENKPTKEDILRCAESLKKELNYELVNIQNQAVNVDLKKVNQELIKLEVKKLEKMFVQLLKYSKILLLKLLKS